MFLILLNGCSSIKTGVNNDLKPSEDQQSIVASNKSLLKKRVIEELDKLQDPEELKATLSFMEHLKRMKWTNRTVMVTNVPTEKFPPFLLDVLKHKEVLNALPRDVDNLVIIERGETAPGTKNVYYRVPVAAVPEPFNLLELMPIKADWEKLVDAKANGFSDNVSNEQAFFALVHEANITHEKFGNNLFAKSMEVAPSLSRLPHPRNTGSKYVLIPLATIRNQAMMDLIIYAQKSE